MTSSPACGARTARRSAPGPARQSAWVCRRGPSSELSSHAAVEFVLDLLQGAGIAAAIGIRPFLPVVLVGLLAVGDLGLDFDGTDWAFLEGGSLAGRGPGRRAAGAGGARRGRGGGPRPRPGGLWVLFPPLAILVLG